jgi:hypothetical protein
MADKDEFKAALANCESEPSPEAVSTCKNNAYAFVNKYTACRGVKPVRII